MTDHINTAAEREKLAALSGFTPGPWEPFFGEAYRVRADGMNIATAHFVTLLDRIPTKQVAVNVCLLAAAPDLLTTVHRLLDALDAERARAEKAEGERDRALARLAVAYESAEELCKRRYHDYAQMVANAERSGPSHPEYICDSTYHHWSGRSSAYYEVATDIRKLTPAAAEAALQRVVNAAWNAAVEAAAQACALMPTALPASPRMAFEAGLSACESHIRALKRPEASHE